MTTGPNRAEILACDVLFEAMARMLRDVGVAADPPKMQDEAQFDTDEQIVLAYLRLRVQARQPAATGAPPANEVPGEAPAAPEPASLPEDIEAPPKASGPQVGLRTLAAEQMEYPDMAIGPEGIPDAPFDATPQPDRVSLPNARAHTPYSARLEAHSEPCLIDDGGTGLTLDAKSALSCEGMKPGEYRLKLKALRDDRPVQVMARLSVIARPQDLWVSKPSDQEAPHAKPDAAFEALQGDAFLVAGSKRGRSHAQEGSYRDDHFAIFHDPESGWHGLIVADGAGSAPLSREGSRVACAAALTTLRADLPIILSPALDGLAAARSTGGAEALRQPEVLASATHVLHGAARAAAAALDARSEALETPREALSTTLSLAVATRHRDAWILASFSVGDGGVAVWDATAGEVEVMCRPDSGEFAGQTRFLTLSELDDPEGAAARTFVSVRSELTALVVMTDGITDPKFETDAALADPERWRAFWKDFAPEVVPTRADPELEKRFLGWLDFWSRGNHDDRTLALLLPGTADAVGGTPGATSEEAGG